MPAPAPPTPRAAWVAAVAAGGCWAVAPPGAPWALAPAILGAALLPRAATGRLAGDLARGGALAALWGAGALAFVPDAWTRFAGAGGLWVAGAAVAAHTVPFALAHAAAGRAPRTAPAAWAAAAGLSALLAPLPLDPAALLAGAPIALWPAALGGRPLLTAALVGAGALGGRGPGTAAALAAGWLAVGGLWLAAGAEPGADSATVGIVEPGFGAYDLRRASTDAARAERLIGAVRGLPAVDWVATPEGAWPYDPGAEGSRARDALERTWRELPPTALGVEVHDGDLPTNSVFAVHGGEVRDRYDKVARLPLGERAVLGLGADRFRAGTGPRVLELAGQRLGVLICYEDLLPTEIPRDTDLILAAAHDGWLDAGRGADGHLAAARLTAVTSGRWVVRATTSGRSAVIDARGRVRWSTPWRDGDVAEPLAPVTHVARVPSRRGAWSGAALAPWVALLGLVFTLAGLIPNDKRPPRGGR